MIRLAGTSENQTKNTEKPSSIFREKIERFAQKDADAYAVASSEHGSEHTFSHPISIEKGMLNRCEKACEKACSSDASTEIIDLDLCTSSTGTTKGIEEFVPTKRSAASPHFPPAHPHAFPSLSEQPADDGNYGVMVRIAHEVLDELRLVEPSSEAVDRVKELCAQRRIDYGAHVAKDVVRRAVESAAAQRLLVPTRASRKQAPSSLAALVQDFRPKLDAMRARAKES